MILRVLNNPVHRARLKFYKLGGYDLHSMKLYMISMRKIMEAKSEILTKERKAELRKYPQDEQAIHEIYDSKAEDYNQNFVGLLLNSALIASASLFEVMFKRVCRFAAYKTRNQFDDPHMQVNDKCKDYLKSIGIKISANDAQWKKINEYIRVRNLITHHAASYRYEKNVTNLKELDTIKHIKTFKYVMVKHPRSKRDKEFLIIDERYINEFLDLCRDYLLWIIIQLPERRFKRARKIY